MKRLLKIAIGFVILVAIVLLVAPYFIGVKIEKTYLTTLSHKVSSATVKPTVQSYKRGWFTSEVEMTLEFDTLSQTTLKGKVIIHHGPITKVQHPDGTSNWELNWYSSSGAFKLYDNYIEKLISSADSIYVYTYHQTSLSNKKYNKVKISPIDLTISSTKSLKMSQTLIDFDIISGRGIKGVINIDAFAYKSDKYEAYTEAKNSSTDFTIYADDNKLISGSYLITVPKILMTIHKLNFDINNLKFHIKTNHDASKKTSSFTMTTGKINLDKKLLGQFKSKAKLEHKGGLGKGPSRGYLFNTDYMILTTNNGDIHGIVMITVPPKNPSEAGKIFRIGDYFLSGKGEIKIEVPKQFIVGDQKNRHDFLASVLNSFYQKGFLIMQSDGSYHTLLQYNNNIWSINGISLDEAMAAPGTNQAPTGPETNQEPAAPQTNQEPRAPSEAQPTELQKIVKPKARPTENTPSGNSAPNRTPTESRIPTKPALPENKKAPAAVPKAPTTNKAQPSAPTTIPATPKQIPPRSQQPSTQQ